MHQAPGLGQLAPSNIHNYVTELLNNLLQKQ